MKVVFLHGLGQGPEAWQQVIHHLDCQDVLALSLFGNLSADEPLSLDILNDQLAAKVAQIKEPYILCGLSLGAILTLMQSLQPSSNLKGLIVSGAQIEPPSRFLLRFQNVIFRFLPKRFFQKIGLTRRQALELTNSLTDLNLSTDLKAMPLSTAVICGQKDRANLSAAYRLASCLGHSKLTIIPKGRHELNVEKPKEFALIVNQFLETHGF